MVAQRHAHYAEEAAEVEVLFASLDKMKSVSKKIQGSMTRLNETGRTVQDAIGPIYGNTQRLQTQNTNIDRILSAIDKVKQPLDMRNKEERILRSRPDRVGLSEYIASIDRTNQALRELKTSNLRSNQTAISELSSLLAVGTGNLESVFRDMLRQDSQPIEPLKQITQSQEFPRIASSKSAQLRTINTNIANYTSQVAPAGDLSPSAKVYALERGQYLTLSLQNLAISCANTARKVSADAMYKPGSCAIGTYAQGIQGMYIAEYDSICPVFQREEWGTVFEATCRESLRTFTNTLRDLDAHVRNHVITDCYLAYEIIDVVSSMYLEIENRTGELKEAMSNALKPIRETAKSSLSTLLNDTKSKVTQMLQLPSDGGPLSITTDVMARLQVMSFYLLPLSSIMRSLGDGGWQRQADVTSSGSVPTLKSFDVGADGKQLFSHYATDSIETLLGSLETKAKQLQKAKTLQGVFLANNIAVIERMIRDSELRTLLGSAQPKVDSWKKKATNLYLDSWKNDVSHFLLDMQYTSKQSARPPSTGAAVDSAAILKSLSSKDKDSIKEKFKNFNTAFDELVAKHKTLRMEPEVRGLLGREVQKFIDPLYARFWERYHEVDKGKGKYVKYDKGQLSQILAGLG
ncbi:Exocyst complex protein exo70 [Fulvia fulva]|uniref:Exocyst complex protein EXO70 n=1 Tax=Passalora fulva TaxID=5499 RepID=A0A9Q8LB06_PASFU|nr:Exocyst complex protein exo70 [Fulvia fulva]KAK4632337.1 Exocyst complex protein exo70 [Fulvia fulva]KAK4633578.1 Exocyst complex protein exo70 [Fulvia fulva]UJO14118.1 Exocyst complex protein exo70 [Fulvia fulva]WPV11892.1 Exocyst complex protein exo70 [Fulvia fulva]WPV26130.1 Exocyst complex protein exo70 [Fulvia fulva]